MTDWTSDRTERLRTNLRDLFRIVRDLEDEFERKFTPDGHLVGSLGEVIVAYAFDLTLETASAENHDAVDKAGRRIQIKLTGGTRGVALRGCPDYIIVIRLAKSGEIELVFNGPGDDVWQNCGACQTNGQRPIGLGELRQLNVRVTDRIAQVRDFPDLRIA